MPLYRQRPETVQKRGPLGRSEIGQLLDIGSDIAEVVVWINSNYNSEDHNLPLSSHLVGLTANLIQRLNTWWQSWEAVRLKSVVATVECSANNSIPLSKQIQYNSAWTAFTVCLYNAIRIIALQTWNRLQHVACMPPCYSQGCVLDMTGSTILLGITSDIKGLAYEIMQSLAFSYRQSHRFIFTISFLFIQDVAYGCFNPRSQEAQWIAQHRWTEFAHYGDLRDLNILKRIGPLGKIKVL